MCLIYVGNPVSRAVRDTRRVYVLHDIRDTTTNIDRTRVLNDSLQSDRTYMHFIKQQPPKA